MVSPVILPPASPPASPPAPASALPPTRAARPVVTLSERTIFVQVSSMRMNAAWHLIAPSPELVARVGLLPTSMALDDQRTLIIKHVLSDFAHSGTAFTDALVGHRRVPDTWRSVVEWLRQMPTLCGRVPEDERQLPTRAEIQSDWVAGVPPALAADRWAWYGTLYLGEYTCRRCLALHPAMTEIHGTPPPPLLPQRAALFRARARAALTATATATATIAEGQP